MGLSERGYGKWGSEAKREKRGADRVGLGARRSTAIACSNAQVCAVSSSRLPVACSSLAFEVATDTPGIDVGGGQGRRGAEWDKRKTESQIWGEH